MLALAGVRHIAGGSGERILLTGPSGCGKSTLTRALAEALDVPWLLIDVTMLSEQNWQGTDISDHLEALYDRHGARAEESVIVLDEVDKLCVRDAERSSKDYRIGKQQSLLPLLGTGSEIPLMNGQRVRPDRMLILMAGVFDGLPAGTAGPGDLVRLGLMHELVERMGRIIRLRPLPTSELMAVLRAGLSSTAVAFRLFGYFLEVPDAVLAYVASRLRSGDEAGPRSGIAWLRSAADRLLVRLLDEAAPIGTIVVLRPDDVLVPRKRSERESGEHGGRSPPDPMV